MNLPLKAPPIAASLAHQPRINGLHRGIDAKPRSYACAQNRAPIVFASTASPTADPMLIEREAPLQSLLDTAQHCRDGHGRIVILGGEAGIGKTALLRELARHIKGDAQMFWGGCEALFTPRPLGPLQDMAQMIDPRLAALLEEGAAQDRIFPALLNVLQKAPGAHVLVFEDVHWADNATLDLIKYLGRRIALLKVVLILSVRSDETGANHPLTHVLGDLPSGSTLRVALRPLSPQGVATLAGQADHASHDLYDITEGNPFFVTELLAASRGSEGIPESIRDAVWSRIARLSAAERDLLEIMSVVPGGVEPWLIRRLAGETADAIADRCAARGMVNRSAAGHLKFRHELARQATLDRVSQAMQQTLHKRVLEAMVRGAPDGASLPLSRLVHHASGAGDGKRVLELAPLAASEAAKLGSHREAAAHLAAALHYADDAPKELAAQLYESWAYEAGVSLRIDESILAARHRAIELWREVGRRDKVGFNLRWVGRLHWYRGESQQAVDYVEQAVAELESLPPGPDLAMAYSARSQLHMLNDRLDEAIAWGEKAITLAEEFGEIETRIHSLNNVGFSLYLSARPGGRERLEESLALALKHGFHDQAVRAYTNFSEAAIVFREFDLAERLLAEGLAYYARNGLAWSHQLTGRQAQLRMEQGHFREAETIAKGVIGLERPTMVMKLPALTVLAIVHTRLGEADGPALLEQALRDATAIGEPQNIAPVRFGMVEAAWLAENFTAAREQLALLAQMDLDNFDPWELGALAVWWQRCAMPGAFPAAIGRISGPRAAELRGDGTQAAEEWTKLGQPYEAALALMQVEGLGAGAALAPATAVLEDLEARPAALLARARARRLGVVEDIPRPKRGPYAASRNHPLGLTHREVQVLGLIAQGLSNQEIARRMVRSLKTVEHHVSAVLGKLNAASRMDVVLRLQSEPWLLPSGEK